MLKNIPAASALILFIFLHAWLAVAADQKLLEDITFDTPSADEERITFKLNGVYIPKIFAMKGERPRVVFDFPDIKPARLLKNIIITNGKFVKRIRMGIHYEPKPKTRIVFDLVSDKEIEFKHDFDTEQKILIITVYHAVPEQDIGAAAGEEKKKQIEETDITGTGAAPKLEETKQEEISTITSQRSEPVKALTPPFKEKTAPVQQETEAKLPDTQSEVELKPAAESEKAPPQQPSAEQKETLTSPAPPAEPVQTVPQPLAKEEIVPAQQKNESQEAPLSPADAQPIARQEKEQAQASSKVPESDKSTPSPLLSSITFDDSTNRGEMVLFKLNGFYPPLVFGVEEGQPRVVCDFKDAEIDDDVPSVIKTNGKYVHTIRIGSEKEPKKIRVVLDLTSSMNYDLQQVFFKDDNLFVVIINSLNHSLTTEELVKPLE